MVVDDPAEAGLLVAQGQAVVLIVAEGALPADWPAGPGRMAVMVGDARSPVVRRAAEAMAAELFGRR